MESKMLNSDGRTDHADTEEVQSPMFACGKLYLADRRPLVLTLCPGNPYYYNKENLLKIIQFATLHTDRVKIFVPDVISEHNYQALGRPNPVKTRKVATKRVVNRLNSVLVSGSDLSPPDVAYVDWENEVEICTEYKQQLEYVRKLFNSSQQFQQDVMQATDNALRCLSKGRNYTSKGNISGGINEAKNENPVNEGYDVMEGTHFLLKELAFFLALPAIYDNFEKSVLIYHKSWPILESLFNGAYDGNVHPCLGFVIIE